MKFPILSADFISAVMSLRTPALVYNADMIDYMVNMLHSDTEGIHDLKVHFSIKSNRNNAVVKYMATLGLGADVASMEEFSVARINGIKEIKATSPYFGIDEVSMLYSNGVVFDFNSISQIRACLDVIRGKRIGLRLRVPLVEETPESLGLNSRFGLIGNEPELHSIIIDNQITVSQVHIHTGEKNLSVIRQICSYLEWALNNNDVFTNVEIVNLGGGLMHLYTEYNGITEFWDYIKIFTEKIKKERPIKFIIEPGMLLAFLSGFLLTSVRCADYREDKRLIVLDCSVFNLFSWIFPRPIYASSTGRLVYHSLCGSSCYENDRFVHDVLLPELNVNDKLMFSPVGAYVSSMQKTLHGLPQPQEYFYRDGLLVREGV